MCGCKGKCGCNINQTTKGEKGDNGANAFKFVKEFIGEDIEQTIVIPYTEWSACGVIPEGCLGLDTIASVKLDIHIQLWLFVPVEFPYWQLLVNGPPATSFSYTTRIDNASGDITIITDNNLGTYRLVILA
jgi:hypothetical protein